MGDIPSYSWVNKMEGGKNMGRGGKERIHKRGGDI